MIVIAGPAGTGKTKELMNTVQQDNGIILTVNKRALQAKAQAYGFKNLDIIELNDLIYDNYDESKPLYIHKLDEVMSEFLKSEFGLNLVGYSATWEE